MTDVKLLNDQDQGTEKQISGYRFNDPLKRKLCGSEKSFFNPLLRQIAKSITSFFLK